MIYCDWFLKVDASRSDASLLPVPHGFKGRDWASSLNTPDFQFLALKKKKDKPF